MYHSFESYFISIRNTSISFEDRILCFYWIFDSWRYYFISFIYPYGVYFDWSNMMTILLIRISYSIANYKLMIGVTYQFFNRFRKNAFMWWYLASLGWAWVCHKRDSSWLFPNFCVINCWRTFGIVCWNDCVIEIYMYIVVFECVAVYPCIFCVDCYVTKTCEINTSRYNEFLIFLSSCFIFDVNY